MIQAAMVITFLGLSASLILCTYRALVGPTVADRAVALDAAIVTLMGFLVVGSMLADTEQYLAYAIVMAVLSYVSTVAYAKYIERGVVIGLVERDPD